MLDVELVLHNLKPENLLFLYNLNVIGSLEVAEYYAEKRNIPYQNILGLYAPEPLIVDYEIPISKEEFEDSILDPILNYLSNHTGSNSVSGSSEIFIIVLGYGFPLSYIEDDGNVISIASRLHRLHYEYEPKLGNPTYDRQGSWKFYDETDNEQVYITAIIDGPTAAAAKKIIDRSIDVDNQIHIAGKIYIDPYGLNETEQQIQYETDILDFVNNSSASLGLELVSTVKDTRFHTDPTVSFLKNDSFYWGWAQSSYSKDLFLNQNQRRVFLYNADDQGLSKLHYLSDLNNVFDPDGSDPWANLAINVEPGYAATAGTVTNPGEYSDQIIGEDAFLRPRPFFESLQRGASLGEAYLFSVPSVNWKNALVGDPLMTVVFPSNLPQELDVSNTTISNNEAIRLIKESIEYALAWGARQARLASELVQYNVDSTELDEQIDLLYGLNKWSNYKQLSNQYKVFHVSILSLIDYIHSTMGVSFYIWLINNGQKITQLLFNLLRTLPARNAEITSDLIHPAGLWEFAFTYIHPRPMLENVHFEMELSRNIDFSDIEIGINSFNDITGWRREQEKNVFVQIVTSGVPSNFSGRKVKYTSTVNNYLRSTEVYYVRWRPLDSVGTPFADYKVESDVLIIKN